MDFQKLRKKYQSELEKLSPHARKVLENASILSFDSFFEQVFTDQTITDFYILRGCGFQSKKELENLIRRVFSCGIEYKNSRKILKSGLKKLKPSALSALDSDCILFFETFFDKFYVWNNSIDQRRAKNCRPVYRKEVEVFVDSVCRSLEAYGAPKVPYYLGIKLPEKSLPEKLDIKNTSFGFLNHYINEPGRLNPVDMDLYRHYFCYGQGYKKKEISKIAKRHKITNTRVLQRSNKLDGIIGKFVRYLTEGQSLNFQKYYCKDYFLINQESASVINKLENTNFSPRFIALVISVSVNSNYDILTFCKEEDASSFLFVKKSIPVDFIGIKNFLENTVKSHRLQKNKIQLLEVLFSFRKYKNLNDKSFDSEKGLIAILRLIIEGIKYRKYRIEMDSSMLTFSIVEEECIV